MEARKASQLNKLDKKSLPLESDKCLRLLSSRLILTDTAGMRWDMGHPVETLYCAKLHFIGLHCSRLHYIAVY